MYLEVWHIVVLCLLFGFCAFYNRKQGFKSGIQITLMSLHNQRVIEVLRDGRIIPGAAK